MVHLLGLLSNLAASPLLNTHCRADYVRFCLNTEVQIDEIPYDVEVILIQKLDAKKTNAKNWWDVGRKIGISRSQLENVDQGESPTKTIISILSTWHDVPTIRKFVEIADKLGRHDICKNVVEFYQNQTPEIVNETPV